MCEERQGERTKPTKVKTKKKRGRKKKVYWKIFELLLIERQREKAKVYFKI